MLDGICFDGTRIHPASTPNLDAVAATLNANLGIKLVEIQSYVGPVAAPAR